MVRDKEQNLSDIATFWPGVLQAHGDDAVLVSSAQRQVMEAYLPAVRRFALKLLGDPHAADDVTQEFGVRFLAGDFHGAHPERGRFRDYVKRAVSNLIADARRRQRQVPQSLDRDDAPEVADALVSDPEREFLAIWRGELFAHTWEALAREDERTRQQLAIVLRAKTEQPKLSADELAAVVGPRLGRPVRASWIHKRVHLARAKFRSLLLDEVARTLDDPTVDELEREVAELGWLAEMQVALEDRRACVLQ